MPAPSDLPEWDTLAANTEAPPAAYKESGWGLTRKLGVSRYMNWWMNLVYQWLLYFRDEGAAYYPSRSFYMGPDEFKYALTAQTALDEGTERGSDWSWMQLDDDEDIIATLNVPNGDTLENLVFEFNDNNDQNITVALRRRQTGANNAYADVVTLTEALASASGTADLVTLTCNHVLADGYQYQIRILKPGATADPGFMSVKVTHKRVP